MGKEFNYEFKTLLTKKEYLMMVNKFPNMPGNLQINYYFDTSRFTLKASDIGLRVRKRDIYEITYKRKRGYAIQEREEEITEEQFNDFVNNGIIPSEPIAREVNEVVKEQKIINYMNLSTYRITIPYLNGYIHLDKCEYVGETDYELLYVCASNEQGKKDFVELVHKFDIEYKKSETKIKRAYAAYRKKM